jgi:RNA polymerase sigma-70 factor (ECF subfamily)
MDFNKLIKENKLTVKNIIRQITNEENDDLEQEVYIKVLKNTQKYEERGTFKAWISTVAKNVSKDYLKSSYYKNAVNSTSEELTLNTIKDERQTPDLKFISKQRQKRIIEAVNNLKPKLKEVIILTEFEDYSYEECAKKLKCPIGTIKSRIYNAKQQLARDLADLM